MRRVTLAFSKTDRLENIATLRLKIEGKGAPLYSLGECEWMEEGLNRGGQDNVLMPGFKPTKGVSCHLYVDASLGSAEEGGDYPIDWRDGRTIELHLDESLASWRSTDVAGRDARFAPLGKGDRVFRLNRAPAAACARAGQGVRAAGTG